MNDKAALIEAIDGELRRALAVAPSMHFTARVRQRVANEPRPASWHQGLKLAAVAAASMAVWFAASFTRPPAGDRPVSMTAPPLAAGPTVPSMAAASPLKQPVQEPDSRGAARAGRPRHGEMLALDTAAPVGIDRWASSASARFVSDNSFAFPMATTLESAPVAASDVREPNEGLLDGRAADIALTYDVQWSER